MLDPVRWPCNTISHRRFLMLTLVCAVSSYHSGFGIGAMFCCRRGGTMCQGTGAGGNMTTREDIRVGGRTSGTSSGLEVAETSGSWMLVDVQTGSARATDHVRDEFPRSTFFSLLVHMSNPPRPQGSICVRRSRSKGETSKQEERAALSDSAAATFDSLWDIGCAGSSCHLLPENSCLCSSA